MATDLLRAAARHGRFILVMGLLTGLLVPDLALAMKPWLPVMVAAQLYLAALRIGLKQVLGSLADLKASLILTIAFQVVTPLLMFSVTQAVGLDSVLTTAIVLMSAAAPLLGSSNLTIMTGNDPTAALRLLVVGLALLPITIVPTLWVLPEIGGIEDIASASLRLLGVVIGVAGIAFATRHFLFRDLSETGADALDGFSAIVMAVVVIGLMAALGPKLRQDPTEVVCVFALAATCNFGLQLVMYFLAGATGVDRSRVAYSIVCGNRNMAFFLAALPASVMEPLFLFIGCYQIPMYLTPLVLERLYRRP